MQGPAGMLPSFISTCCSSSFCNTSSFYEKCKADKDPSVCLSLTLMNSRALTYALLNFKSSFDRQSRVPCSNCYNLLFSTIVSLLTLIKPDLHLASEVFCSSIFASIRLSNYLSSSSVKPLSWRRRSSTVSSVNATDKIS